MVIIRAIGIRALSTQFHQLPSRVSTELGARIKDFSERSIMKESLRMCPKETGALRSTNNVRQIKARSTEVQVELSYGGRTPGSSEHFESGAKITPYVEYAWLLHEETYKNYTTPGTGPKYLEIPILNNRMDLERIIRSGVQTATLAVFMRGKQPAI